MVKALRIGLRALGWAGFGLGVLFGVLAFKTLEALARGDVAMIGVLLIAVVLAVGLLLGGGALLAGANAGRGERNRRSDMLRALGLVMLAVAYLLGEEVLGTLRYLVDVGPDENISELVQESLKGRGVIVLSCLALVLLVTGRRPWARVEEDPSQRPPGMN